MSDATTIAPPQGIDIVGALTAGLREFGVSVGREIAKSLNATGRALVPTGQGQPADTTTDKGVIPPKRYAYDPLDAIGRITEDAAPLNNHHPGTIGLTFHTLNRLSLLPTPNLVINLAISELAEFCTPQANPHSYGCRVRLADLKKKPTRQQELKAAEILKVVLNAGGKFQKGGLEGFVRRYLRDSLRYDAAVMEKIRDRLGRLWGFVAVDAKTIRYKSPSSQEINQGVWGDAGFVQIVDDRIVREWSSRDMSYGVRNPRSDMEAFGLYGFPELEQLLSVLMNLTRGENFNAVNFTSGIHASAILAMYMAGGSEDAFEANRRYLDAYFANPTAKRRWPVLGFDASLNERLEHIPLSNTNVEMEFMQWLYHNMKFVFGMFGMDPAVGGFVFGNEGQNSSMGGNSSAEERYEISRAKGTRPRLRFVQNVITEDIVQEIDDEFVFEFTGFDALSENEKLDLDIKAVSNIKTLNEVRAEYDLKALPAPWGDMVLNPTWLGAVAGERSQDRQFDQQQMMQQQSTSQDPGDMSDRDLMASLHANIRTQEGDDLDTITTAIGMRFGEAIDRGLIRLPKKYRAGRAWTAAPREGGREPRVVTVRV